MKNNHIHLKRLAAISLVVVMCLSALPMLAPSASAEPVAVSNERIGDRVVFQQDYSTMFQVPDNVFLGYAQSPLVENTSLTYDYMNRALKFTGGQNALGQLFIAGLTPAITTNISLEAEMSRSDQYVRLKMHIGDARLTFELLDGSLVNYGRVTSSYFDPSGEEVTQTSDNIDLSSMDETSWRFTVTVQFNGVTNSNIIYIDGVQVLETPAYSLYHPGLAQPFPSFSSPIIYIYYANMASEGKSGEVRIYSVTQTVPDYQYVTPIGNAKIQPFGLDGPHEWQFVRNGISYLQSTGGRGTIWADVKTQFAGGYSSEDLAALKALLADGWELGIHFSRSLSSLSMEDAIALMIEEYDAITQLFGQSPTSWCSLGNAENPSHAEYAYHVLGLVWRNGYNGVGHGINGIRGTGLYDTKWYYHEAASEAGLITPIYTHRTDQDPAEQYAISYSNFTIWVDNYAAAGVTIVPWIDYWQTAQNTGHTAVSDLMVDDGKSMSFTLDNIGGRSRLFVAAPWTEIVVDGDGNKVPFEEVDGGIIMEVEAGEYQVMTMSAYRGEQIDRAFEPLYAIIPVVIVLAVLGGLITMVGRIKF